MPLSWASLYMDMHSILVTCEHLHMYKYTFMECASYGNSPCLLLGSCVWTWVWKVSCDEHLVVEMCITSYQSMYCAGILLWPSSLVSVVWWIFPDTSPPVHVFCGTHRQPLNLASVVLLKVHVFCRGSAPTLELLKWWKCGDGNVHHMTQVYRSMSFAEFIVGLEYGNCPDATSPCALPGFCAGPRVW